MAGFSQLNWQRCIRALLAFSLFGGTPAIHAQGLGPDNARDLGNTWRTVQLDEDVAETRYRILEQDERAIIEAIANNSMTLLARRVDTDLSRTPVLCWQWRVDAPLQSADLSRKSGDDYAARVYLTYTVAPDQLGFTTRTKLRIARLIYGPEVPDAAVNYVWDNLHPVGTMADNAYTDRARMLVLRSGPERAGQWVNERRNLLEDFRRAFGHEPEAISLLAVASDTDNTGEKARAAFAGFALVSEDEPCPLPGTGQEADADQ